MDRNEGIWLSWDGVLRALGSLIELALSMFRPFTHFLMEVSNGSWLGLCVVVSIFFSVYLIRAGARAGSGNRLTFSRTLEYYSGWGLPASIVFCIILTLEWLFVPIVTLLFTAALNSITGGEPGLGQFFAFLMQASPARAAFITDVMRFYGEANTVMPLGFRFSLAIVFLFGTMRLVGRGMAKLAS